MEVHGGVWRCSASPARIFKTSVVHIVKAGVDSWGAATGLPATSTPSQQPSLRIGHQRECWLDCGLKDTAIASPKAD